MKRVLNSGTIKLPYVQGSEENMLSYLKPPIQDWEIGSIVEHTEALDKVVFTFEIKAPLLVLQSFQNAHLGRLNVQEMANHLEGYLPLQFYKQDPFSFIPVDPKSCNELNTKLNNFYNWSFNFYNKLIESGLCKEQAELMLPQGLFTSFIWEVSAKDLIEFIDTNYNKSPELAGYCFTLSLYVDDHLPFISSWLKKNKWKNLLV